VRSSVWPQWGRQGGVSSTTSTGARAGRLPPLAASVAQVDGQVADPFDSVRESMQRESPESYRLLVENENPSNVNALDLIQSLSPVNREGAKLGYERDGGVRTLACLTAEECKRIRDFIDETTQHKWHGPNARANVHWTTRIDSVDKAPDYQINLFPSDLQRIVGDAGFKRIWSIPRGLEGLDCTEEMDSEAYNYKRVGVFLRKYTTDTRPFILFHVDSNSCTGNVALNADADYEGGNLLTVTGGKVQVAQRKEGEATVHDNRVLHGVSSMVSGTRYSMILFFEKGDE